MVHSEFTQWIEDEINKRHWTYNELARRAGLSSGGISLVMTGQRNPSVDFCTGIAKAFEVAPVTVFRKAGPRRASLRPGDAVVPRAQQTTHDLLL